MWHVGRAEHRLTDGHFYFFSSDEGHNTLVGARRPNNIVRAALRLASAFARQLLYTGHPILCKVQINEQSSRLVMMYNRTECLTPVGKKYILINEQSGIIKIVDMKYIEVNV